LSEEEEKGIRVSVTFPKMDAEWLQEQVEKGDYTSLAEVVRMCVRTMRAGGPGISLRVSPREGGGLTIPTEVALEAIKNPEILMHLLESLTEPAKAKEKAKTGPTAPPGPTS